jgi:hypothetical protein
MPFRLATFLGRDEARWRNEKRSVIEIASATAFRIFFWRQVSQFDRQFPLGRFLFRHLDRSLDVWASWDLDVPLRTIERVLGSTREMQGQNATLQNCSDLAARQFGGKQERAAISKPTFYSPRVASPNAVMAAPIAIPDRLEKRFISVTKPPAISSVFFGDPGVFDRNVGQANRECPSSVPKLSLLPKSNFSFVPRGSVVGCLPPR